MAKAIKKTKKNGPVVLAVLDGWGLGPKDPSVNAIAAAKTAFFNHAITHYPFTQLDASGEAVGLEKNQMSGSEAGHLNIGAGRVVKQDVRSILEDIDQGRFFDNPAFLSAIHKVKRAGTNVHLMGLMGNADSPHSHPDIFLALLILLKKHQLEDRVFVHLFTDGRDSYPQSAMEHLQYWKGMMEKVGIGTIATITGRFYAMDRAKNWDRLLMAYHAIVEGHCDYFQTPEEAIVANYQRGNFDEYVEPTVIIKNGRPVGKVRDGDAVFFFNFRSDRARQFAKLFVGMKNGVETNFPRITPPQHLSFVAMTNFGPDLNLVTAYPTHPVVSTLPVALCERRQLYIAETEKFAHITYFINGGYPDSIGGEERIMIPSPVIRSYADQPEMSAGQITDTVIGQMQKNEFDFIAINYANADMVGHTGDFSATAKAVAFVDAQLKRLYSEIAAKDGMLILTSDHGNADIMYDKKAKQPFTFHTKNPVPLVMMSEHKGWKVKKLETCGRLANIAPTILDLFGVAKPKEMEAGSLIKKR